MTGALEHAEVGALRAHCVTVLVGHYPGDLVEMSQVVDGPGCEELREGDRSKGGVASAAVEVATRHADQR